MFFLNCLEQFGPIREEFIQRKKNRFEVCYCTAQRKIELFQRCNCAGNVFSPPASNKK